ncbi:hypothetical protein HPP92_029179, partial [Vanilla planifolia]
FRKNFVLKPQYLLKRDQDGFPSKKLSFTESAAILQEDVDEERIVTKRRKEEVEKMDLQGPTGAQVALQASDTLSVRQQRGRLGPLG